MSWTRSQKTIMNKIRRRNLVCTYHFSECSEIASKDKEFLRTRCKKQEMEEDEENYKMDINVERF